MLYNIFSKLIKRVMKPRNQYNAITKALYEGNGNQISLQLEAQEKGYRSNKWVTFLQAKKLNLQVKKGSKGVRLVHVRDEEREKNGKRVKERVFSHFVVFNLDQTVKKEAKND
jgi:antirestriction protein ArdC